LEKKETCQIFREAFGALDEFERVLIEDHLLKGLSLRALSKIWRMPVTTLRYRYLQALKRLREILETMDFWE
jgi:DNA-directed RNA polymerase specialized sigma24 family protein